MSLEGRKMTDIHRRLQHNSTAQRQAQQTAEYFELERQGKEIEERGQVSVLCSSPISFYVEPSLYFLGFYNLGGPYNQWGGDNPEGL